LRQIPEVVFPIVLRPAITLVQRNKSCTHIIAMVTGLATLLMRPLNIIIKILKGGIKLHENFWK